MEGAPLLPRRRGRRGRTAEQHARPPQAGDEPAPACSLAESSCLSPGQIGRHVSVRTPPHHHRPRVFARPHSSPSSRSSESFLLGEPREAPARGTTTPHRPDPRLPRRTAGGGQRALPPFWVNLWRELWVPDLASARASPLRRAGGQMAAGNPATRASPRPPCRRRRRRPEGEARRDLSCSRRGGAQRHSCFQFAQRRSRRGGGRGGERERAGRFQAGL